MPAVDLSFMDQSVEVKSPAPQPQPEPEPEPQQPQAGSFVGDESVDVDIGKGSFKQHDLSATTLLLESSPNRVECVATSSENLDHTVYVFKVFTPDGREWVISKRFSDFDKLRAELLKDGNPGVKSIPFPRKSWNPFRPASESVELERKVELQQWMNDTIEMCPGVKAVEMFLADDSSLDPSMEAQLVAHLGSQTVTKAADAAPLDSMGRGGSSLPSGAAPASSDLSASSALPAELTLEGRAQAQAAEAAAALKKKELAETMDEMSSGGTLVITTAEEEFGGKRAHLSLPRKWASTLSILQRK